MKILVTGGAGFIGSSFIRYMLKQHENVRIVNLDMLTYAGSLGNLKDVEDNQNYSFIKGDITDNNLVDNIFISNEIDYVINFAAESHVDRSIEDPQIFLKTNVIGTQVLLDASRKNYVKKFLQVSTDEVYGSLGKSGYFTEKSPICPSSPYSASKASADLLVKSYAKTFGLPINITRCSNNYGPYQFPEKLIPLMIINAMNDKELPIYGDGLNIRDWIYVEDHCRAIEMVLYHGKAGKVYNIGSNNEITNMDVVKYILKELGKPESLIRHITDRPGHDRRYAIDSTKIQEEVGWKPLYNFEEGMKYTIRWYLDNKEWWQEIITGEYQHYYAKMYINK